MAWEEFTNGEEPANYFKRKQGRCSALRECVKVLLHFVGLHPDTFPIPLITMETPLKRIPRAQAALTLAQAAYLAKNSTPPFQADAPPFSVTLAGYPITLEQNERTKLFTVTYGEQVDAHLSYGRACHKLGAAILHALSCEQKIDSCES